MKNYGQKRIIIKGCEVTGFYDGVNFDGLNVSDLSKVRVPKMLEINMRTFYKGVLVFSLLFAFMFVVGLTIVLYTGMIHQKKSMEFWGKLYNEENDSSLNHSVIANALIPRGGPMVSSDYFHVCDGTPLPLVPVRITNNNRVEVLCGISKGSHEVMSVTAHDKASKSALDLLTRALKEEYKSTY